MRKFILIAVLGLGGCAGVSDAMTYSGIPVTRFQYAEDNWRIFDDPAKNRMMTTPSVGKASAAGAANGLTLGLAQAIPEGLQHKEMVVAYMASTGRGACTITKERKVIYGQYEFEYECPAS